MEYLIVFFAAIAAAVGAVGMPGMLNMTIISTSLKWGRSAAITFAAGVATVFLVQATVGIIGGRYLSMNTNIIEAIKVWAIPAFLLLAVFFFYRGYRKHTENNSSQKEEDPESGRLFARGMSLAAMNLLIIPYFYALSIWLFRDGPLITSLSAKIIFVITAACGAFSIFSTYAVAAPWVRKNARPLTRNINFVVGSLMITVALFQTYRMLKGS